MLHYKDPSWAEQFKAPDNPTEDREWIQIDRFEFQICDPTHFLFVDRKVDFTGVSCNIFFHEVDSPFCLPAQLTAPRLCWFRLPSYSTVQY